MNTNQLTPELVEKMSEVLRVDLPIPKLSEQCAQIAVDYSAEQNAYIQHTYNESLEELRNQRDELLGLLVKISNRIKNDTGGNFDSVSDYLSNLGLDAEILIQKYDGK